jgi:hypothetical protein
MNIYSDMMDYTRYQDFTSKAIREKMLWTTMGLWKVTFSEQYDDGGTSIFYELQVDITQSHWTTQL